MPVLLLCCALLCRSAQQLCQVLDGMHARKERLAGRFELCGPQHRSTGSHGIVEFVTLPAATSAVSARCCYSQCFSPMYVHKALDKVV
jgi:hypothetical protein